MAAVDRSVMWPLVGSTGGIVSVQPAASQSRCRRVRAKARGVFSKDVLWSLYPTHLLPYGVEMESGMVQLPSTAEQNVDALVERITEVCPIPAAANRVMELTAHHDAKIEQVAEAVAVDPALAAETMRIANSPVFGGAGRVRDLEQAVLKLGLNELHNMAAAMAMMAAFKSEAELSLQLHERSVLSGALAGLLARATKLAPRGAAFLCGLLAEIGAMACLSVDEEYAALWADTSENPQRRAEQETARYGASSYEVGRRLLRRNNLPGETADAIGTLPGADSQGLTGLARITVFSRRVTPLLVEAVTQQAYQPFREELEALRSELDIGMLSTERLLELCVEAGMKSESALRR